MKFALFIVACVVIAGAVLGHNLGQFVEHAVVVVINSNNSSN